MEDPASRAVDAPPPTHAWVVLVFKNTDEGYAKGAVVLANSLWASGTKYPIVCLYNGLSDETVAWMARIFDRMIEVPLIEHKTTPMPSSKQRNIYSSWIDKSFTKWQCVNPAYMSDYNKVILLDSDSIVFSNMDGLFDLPAPAGVFATPWGKPYAENGLNNPYMRNGATPAHGSSISDVKVQWGLRNSFVADASLVVLEPSERLFRSIQNCLKCETYGYTKCRSGVDEQIIAEAALKAGQHWTHVHPSYSCHVGKEFFAEGQPIKMHGWYNMKPWNDKRGSVWPDVEMWYDHWEAVTAEHPPPASLK